MRYTDDPAADFLAHDTEQEKALAKLPHCDDCGEPIQDDEAYYYHGDVICEDIAGTGVALVVAKNVARAV